MEDEKKKASEPTDAQVDAFVLGTVKTLEEVFGPVISSYSADQAVEDGYLVKTGDPQINLMTRRVYDTCIEQFVIKTEDGKPMPGLPTPAKIMRNLLERTKRLLASRPNDDFYSVTVSGWQFFVERNETGAFTMLFPDEH